METNPKVTALGGIFITCDNPEEQNAWYAKHLGMKNHPYGANFVWRRYDAPDEKAYSLLSFFKKDSDYLKPGRASYMINFRVQHIEALVEKLKAEGVTVCDEIESYDYGKFVHILDPEGNKIELWEANDEVYGRMGSEDLLNY